jgi:hypothetical protein
MFFHHPYAHPVIEIFFGNFLFSVSIQLELTEITKRFITFVVLSSEGYLLHSTINYFE